MQEPDSEQDDDYCNLLQQLLNMGDDGGASESQGTLGETAQDSVNEASSRPLEADPASLPQVGGSSFGQGSSAGGVQPQLTQEYLAAILSGMTGGPPQAQESLPSLSQILTPQNLVPLLENEAVRKRLGELVEHLPNEHQQDAQKQPYEAAAITLRSAPLRNQVRTLSHALASGQLDFSQLGLETLGFSAADFLKSIQKMMEGGKEKQ